MKKKLFTLLIGVLMMFSCSPKLKFPISNVTPGAEITAKVKNDNHGNYEINITAKYLTSSDRLVPSRSFYLVWLETADNGVINLGKLDTDVSSKAEFRTVTPYNPKELFITAEDDAKVKFPTGEEISRVSID